MPEQIELFKPEGRTGTSGGMKKERDPRRAKKTWPELLDESFSLVNIDKTKKLHQCGRCDQEIPIGSRAIKTIDRKRGRLDFNRINYFHRKESCPAWDKK